ncbi:MAG: universal stress protein [Halioglobus sp.]
MGKMLVIADLKDSCIATPRGLQLAQKLGHAVEVVAFTYAPLSRMNKSNAEQKAIKSQLLEKRRRDVQARIDKYRAADQAVSLKVVWEKDIHHWVIKRSTQSIDMVVKTGSHKDSIIHTSTDWQLLRECRTPVLIVAEKKWHKTRPVLAAIDLGATSAQKKQLNHLIISRAKVLAEALDAELHLICAIEIPTLLADMDLIDPSGYVREAREKMAPAIAELAKAHDLPARSFRIKKGPVEKVITSVAAKQRAQLLVMGTVGRRGVRARLLGNTAEKVLRHLRTDVLTLKLPV